MILPGMNDYNRISPHGAQALRTRITTTHTPVPEGRKKHSKKQVSSGLTTAGLMIGSALLAYKCRGGIQKAIAGCKKVITDSSAKVASKCPNLSQAGSSFVKACKTPINAVRKFFKI